MYSSEREPRDVPRREPRAAGDEIIKTTSWPFVRTMVERDVVDSTSDVAAALVRERSAVLPLAVWAHRQTRGRGRGTHEWWSDAGSLTFTLAIDPAAHGLTLTNEPKIALSTAVAVIDAMGELGFGEAGIGIRWPNDLECAGRKLGGILPERLESSDGHRVLIGVGLNVRTNLDPRTRRRAVDGHFPGRALGDADRRPAPGATPGGDIPEIRIRSGPPGSRRHRSGRPVERARRAAR